jgi:leader peptidase (prepilin peptidase)/N-methyltransferase
LKVPVSALFILMVWTVGLTPVLPLWLYLAAAGTALFLIDIDHQRLPDVIVLPSWGVTLVGLGVAAAFTTGAGDHLVHAGWGALTFGGVYMLIFCGTLGRGMGLGDVKLAPVLGAALGWFGWGATLVGLMGGFVIGGGGRGRADHVWPTGPEVEGPARPVHAGWDPGGAAVQSWAVGLVPDVHRSGLAPALG